MFIDLYTTTDDPRVADKNINVISLNVVCKPSQPFSILSPRIILNYSIPFLAVNYVYIPDFKRYYFAEVVLLPGKELQLICNVDPLMSWDISNCTATVIRSESAGINYVPDPQLPVDPSRNFLEGRLFPLQPLVTTPGDDYTYLLIINGG